jgi:type I restriction enzyme R subunit
MAKTIRQLRKPDAAPFRLLETKAAGGGLRFAAVRKYLPDVPRPRGIPPISHHGNVAEIIGKFGGPDQLRNAVNQLQSLLYAA